VTSGLHPSESTVAGLDIEKKWMAKKQRRAEMDDYNKQSGQFSSGESTGTGETGTAARMKEQAASKVADDFGRKAAEKFDESRESAAGALDQTASSLHSSGDKLSGAAHSAADKIQAGADYVRRTDLHGMAHDLQDLVKRYPGQSLAAAAILGFLVARGFRGD
jgi:ElaB/YqjD/DUF883 family membrane-anchored ribosome-binding protein